MVAEEAAPQPIHHNLKQALEMLAKKPPSFTVLINEVAWFLNTFIGHTTGYRAVMFLADNRAGGLRLVQTCGQFSHEFLEAEAFVPFGHCLCGRAASSGEVYICKNCFDDPRHETRWYGMDAHGHYVIPLTSNDAVLGVLTFYTHEGVQENEGKKALLFCVARQAGKGLSEFLRSSQLTRAGL